LKINHNTGGARLRKPAWCIALVLTALMFSAPMVFAQNAADGDGKIKPGKSSKEELAKASQNPVADMISLPLFNLKENIWYN
jgi:hypothetical protein